MRTGNSKKPKIRLDAEGIASLCISLHTCSGLVQTSFPAAAKTMVLAEETIADLHDKAEAKKIVLLSDLDPMAPMYKVVDEHGWEIGKKSVNFGYMKPEYQKNGRRTGGKCGSFDARYYKGLPPWLKYEVIKIDQLGGFLTFHVKKTVSGS